MKCSECEKLLTGEEEESPRFRTGDTGGADDCLCDACYDESGLEFECCLCCDWEHDAYQDRIGDCVAVGASEGDQVELLPGVYRIVSHPYYAGGLLGTSHVHKRALAWVASLPAGVEMDGYPLGHCCRSCALKFPVRVRRRARIAIYRGH